MTDATVEPIAVKGRSLWGDAWLRLKANKAAVGSAFYLALVILACLIGPNLTGHDFRTIYQSYVRVPPSLSPYPQQDAIEAGLKDALKRTGVEVTQWTEMDGRVLVTVTGTKPVDTRITRYVDRSDSFDDTQVVSTAADGLSLTMSAAIDQKYFLLGTDPSGRDLLTRTLVAGRVSLAIGLLAGLVALAIGVVYGAAAGLIGGKTDEIMMRIVDILYALPFTFFVIMLVVFFGRNFVLMFIAVGAVLWLDMARIVRGQTLSIRRQEYVQAAEALGVGSAGILWRHVIPNALGPIIVYVTLLVPQVIILESFLSFLGLGVQEPMSSWGVQISQGARSIETATWLLLYPSLLLTTTLFALNFIGDGLRDALDPKDR
ncbi:MAG: ABC transporter permease subunit [Hyphomicrobiaceae bacterium]